MSLVLALVLSQACSTLLPDESVLSSALALTLSAFSSALALVSSAFCSPFCSIRWALFSAFSFVVSWASAGAAVQAMPRASAQATVITFFIDNEPPLARNSCKRSTTERGETCNRVRLQELQRYG